MSMRWDPILAAAAARELSEALAGARVRAILLDAVARRVTLFLREQTLALELHPQRGWISLLPAAKPPPEARAFPVRIRSVTAPPDESALVFGLPRVRGKDEGIELVAEMVGNRWNAVVIGHRSRTIRHVLVPRSRGRRQLTVGAPYELPPSTGRKGVDRDLSSEEWDGIVAAAGEDAEARSRAILGNVAWTSSINVRTLLGPDGRERWLTLTDPARWGGHLLPRDGAAQPYPVPLDGALEGAEAEPRSSLLDAIIAARGSDPESGPARELLLPPGLLERGEDRLRRARGKVRGLRREMENATDPGPVRELGDLILARFSEIPQGVERTTLTGFDGEPVEVELDPTRPAHENAARYYDEAARMERARAELPARIDEAEAEVERLESTVEAVRTGASPPASLAEALGPDPKRGGGGPGAGGGGSTLPYRRYTSSGGLEIRVGRGARHNDDLTFRYSDPQDVWLHVRQAPGAHVILRWKGEGNPPRRDLVEAATLAALSSEARHSGSVPVDWTRRKYVRKPRKAPPGAVVPDRVETVFVEPVPELEKRLRK